MTDKKLLILFKIARPLRKELESLFGYPKDCAGLCAIATAELHRRLKAIRIDSTMVVWNGNCEGHCFLLVDEMMVDITATQFHGFEKNKILIKPFMMMKESGQWKATKTFTSIKPFRDYLLDSEWSSEQIPHLESEFKEGQYVEG